MQYILGSQRYFIVESLVISVFLFFSGNTLITWLGYSTWGKRAPTAALNPFGVCLAVVCQDGEGVAPGAGPQRQHCMWTHRQIGGRDGFVCLVAPQGWVMHAFFYYADRT